MEARCKKAMINLPSELLNEPYSREPRPPYCKIVRPQRFMFCIVRTIAHCVVDYNVLKSIYTTYRRGDQQPVKSSSACSVLAVYELYGLDISLAYLDHLSVKDLSMLRERAWIQLYLRGSLSEIQQAGPIHNENIQALIGLLSSELRRLEQAQPVVATDSSCCTLPIEIVARIVRRVDISTRLTSILYSTDSIYPTMVKLGRLNKKSDAYSVRVHPDNLANNCMYILVMHDRENNIELPAWQLTQHADTTFTLEQEEMPRTYPLVDIEYSLAAYDLFYGSKRQANNMLSKIRERLASPSTKDEVLICCWLVQLACNRQDAGIYYDEQRNFDSVLELAAELTSLIDLVMLERA
ncbi:Hypothetical protein POVR2_LOCUS240 [uncultured virus]|nr:Hypothetical protein POVR2_LOCUS240 [uncultured virus]